MDDLERAKAYLAAHDGELTLVFSRGEELFTSSERGVKPLLGFLERGISFEGGAAADKVVGRGGALLHVMLKTQRLYAGVISLSAAEVLDYYNVEYSFGEKAERILNRKGDGVCPIEQATEGIFNLNEARAAILKRLNELKEGKAQD